MRYVTDIGRTIMSICDLLLDFIKPICLPRIGFIPNAKDNFLVSGWGRTETGTYKFPTNNNNNN